MGFPPVSAGSSCRAFVRSLARAFIRAASVLVASLAVGPAPPSETRFAAAHGLVGASVVMLAVMSQLLRRCRGAVAPTIAAVAVTLPSRRRSIAPSWSHCRHALVGDRHASAPRAVPRCLVGLVGRPWLRDLVSGVVGVVVTVVGGGRRAYAPCAVLVSLPGRPQLCAPLDVVVGIVVGAIVGVLVTGGATSSSSASSIVDVNAASSTPVASGRLRRARRPPPSALMGVVVGFVVAGKHRL